MYIKMIVRALALGAVFQVLVMGYILDNVAIDLEENAYIKETNTHLPLVIAVKYYTGLSFSLTEKMPVEKVLQPYSKGWEELAWYHYRAVADYASDGIYKYYGQYIEKWFYRSFGAYTISLLYLFIFWGTARRANDSKFIRGMQLTPLKELNKKLAKAARRSPLSYLKIGETALPFDLETKHMLILGAAGSGKGVLLNQLIAQINERKKIHNNRCIFYDPKGEFVAKQLRKKDLIFSPFDARTLRWNIFNELEIPPDFDVVSRSLFASPEAKDSYWYNCAADVFRTGLVYLKLNNTISNIALWNFFSQPLAAIQAAFKTLPISEQGALKHIDKSDSPASASIISILQERIQFFRYLTDIDGDFSFRKFIRDQGHNAQANLFILNIEQYATLFKPLMTLAIDTMCREALSLPDDLQRRIFFVLDELGTLNRMDSILKLETVGRSKGACLICSNQDLGRIEEQYGRANLKTFFNNFNTNITFRIREPETSEFLSRAIGDQQLIKSSNSRQMSAGEIGDRKSVSEQEKTERLILPTEFQTLPDLYAFINIAGYGVSRIEIPAVFYRERHPNFVMRDFSPWAAEPPSPTAPAKPDFDKLKI
jgi:type IV secretory pathway TraG/TraD family ATPase VirD4